MKEIVGRKIHSSDFQLVVWLMRYWLRKDPLRWWSRLGASQIWNISLYLYKKGWSNGSKDTWYRYCSSWAWIRRLTHSSSLYIESFIKSFVSLHDTSTFGISHYIYIKKTEVMVRTMVNLISTDYELVYDFSLMFLACILRELVTILFPSMIDKNLKYLAVLLPKGLK